MTVPIFLTICHTSSLYCICKSAANLNNGIKSCVLQLFKTYNECRSNRERPFKRRQGKPKNHSINAHKGAHELILDCMFIGIKSEAFTIIDESKIDMKYLTGVGKAFCKRELIN